MGVDIQSLNNVCIELATLAKICAKNIITVVCSVITVMLRYLDILL